MIEIQDIGKIIRDVRKEKGFRLEDLADEKISPATISNIERGVPHVIPEKREYLLGKLGLNLNDLSDLLLRNKENIEELDFNLFTIETLRDIGEVEKAYEKLTELVLEDTHPMASRVYFLKGKCLYSQKKWKKAERQFYNAIRHAAQSGYTRKKILKLQVSPFYLLSVTITISLKKR